MKTNAANLGKYDRATHWYGEQFSRFRGRNGDFRYWLQIFTLRPKPAKDGGPVIDIMKIAPWIFDDTRVDREVLLSMFRLGLMKHLPAHWSNDDWEWLDPKPNEFSAHAFPYDSAREHSPVYAVLCEGMSGPALIQQLNNMAGAAGIVANSLQFWEAMRAMILLPALNGSYLPDVIANAASMAEQVESINQEIDK